MPHAALLDSARRKAFWRLMPLLFIGYMIAYIDRNNLAIAALTMPNHLEGFDKKVIGLGAGMFFWGYLLLEIPGTILVERWSARKWITRIMFTWGIIAGLTALVKTPGQFYTMRFLLGLAEAGFFPGVIVYLTHWFTTRDRAKMLALFFCASPLAQIINPLVSKKFLPIGEEGGTAALWGMVSWQWIFVFWAVPAVLLSFVVFFYLTDRPRQAKWLAPEEAEALESELEKEKAVVTEKVGVWQALTHPMVLLLTLVYFLAVGSTYAVEFFLPTLLREWYALDFSSLTWLVVLPPLLAMIAQPATGWSSDHFKERRWHAVIPLLIAALAMGLLPFSKGQLWLTVTLLMICLAGCKAYMPAFWSLPYLFLSNAAAAASIGMINSLGNLGGFFGPYITGKGATDTGSFNGPLFIFCAALASAAVVIFIITTWVKRPPSEAEKGH